MIGLYQKHRMKLSESENLQSDEIDDLENEMMFHLSNDFNPKNNKKPSSYITPLINDQKPISELLTDEINRFSQFNNEVMVSNREY